jgi:hypothetical protein
MKKLLLYGIIAFGLLALLGCGRKCGCEPGPKPADFQFRILDTTGRDMINNPKQFDLYYLSGTNKVNVSDFYIYHNESDTIPWPIYYGATNQAAELSIQSTKDFYFELGYGDIDTVHIEATHQNDYNKVNTVLFNGVQAQQERGAWMLIKKEFK